MRVGEPVSEARAKLEDADIEYLLVVDENEKPKGWLSERGLQGERVTEDFRSKAEPVVEMDDVLRDALSDLLETETRYGAVVDAEGKVQGILSLEVISQVLQAPPEDVPHGADAFVGDD